MRYLLLCLFLFTSCEYIPQNKVVMQADNTRFNIMYPDSTLSSTYVDSAYTAFKDSMLNVKLDSLSSELAYYVDVCLPDLMLRILAIETGSGATELVWNKNIDPVKRPTWFYDVYFDDHLIGTTVDTVFALSGKKFAVKARNDNSSGYSNFRTLVRFKNR